MEFHHYGGIDTGYSGALAVINRAGTVVRVWDMPTRKAGKTTTYTALDFPPLRAIFRRLMNFPGIRIGMEEPFTRPDEPAQRSFRFGRQVGILESFLYCHNISYLLFPPNKWKGRLNLPGKSLDPNSKVGAALWDRLYPYDTALIRGPRGGVLDGRLDALLMAHYMREQDPMSGLYAKSQHGDRSPEHLARLMQKGRKKIPSFLQLDDPTN